MSEVEMENHTNQSFNPTGWSLNESGSIYSSPSRKRSTGNLENVQLFLEIGQRDRCFL